MNERGASAVEYGLILVLLAAACVVILPALGVSLDTYLSTCLVGAVRDGVAPAGCG